MFWAWRKIRKPSYDGQNEEGHGEPDCDESN